MAAVESIHPTAVPLPLRHPLHELDREAGRDRISPNIVSRWILVANVDPSGLDMNCQEVVCRFEPDHRGNSTNAAVRPVPVVVMLPAM